MKISIVMTTFNGSKYIIEQLQSVRCQSRTADEVIILDDASTDDTVNVIKKFIDDYKLDTWKLLVNKKNTGWKKNFINGFEKATGELIFPCDQDDIWYKDKLEYMEKIMVNEPHIELLIGQADYIYDKSDSDNKLKSKLYAWTEFYSKLLNIKSIKKEKINRCVFNSKFKNVYQGCLMCFRKTFFDDIKKYWFPDLAHDNLLQFYAELQGTCYIVNRKVIHYRFHFGSASNPLNSGKEYRIKKLLIDEKEIVSLIKNFDEYRYKKENLNILKSALNWNRNRQKLVMEKNILSGIILLRYLCFYRSKKHYISDWLYGLGVL